MKLIKNSLCIFAIILATVITGSLASARDLIDVEVLGGRVRLVADDGSIEIRALTASAVEVVFMEKGEEPFPSYALAEPAASSPLDLVREDGFWRLDAGELEVFVDAETGRLSFVRNVETFLQEEKGFDKATAEVGFRFELPETGLLMGGGSRLPGMDRRGQQLELYNKASYGYETEADLMYYSLPMILSSERFGLIFDNGARGMLDFGKADPDILEFGAEGGRSSYVVFTGDTWADVMGTLTEITGRQPLPPRWSLGNISSRMGYRSQAEVEWVAEGYAVKDLPVDAIVIDLYWFGPDIKGHMGNLAWDHTTFPEPEKMMEKLSAMDIRTILITEPFVLTTSNRFKEVAELGLLGTDGEGAPYTYEFYFGTTGLLDIFKKETREWFWDIYRDLTNSGVGGWWGDLGEPEVHPDDLQHSLGSAVEVHNLYGHEWARLVFEGYARDFPDERPLILMRSGFVGTQRYGIIPWTGDVNRTWGGLQSQVTLALQMSLQGLAYMHSDLGGFAGDNFDPELYTRWMQYGTFQPVYRPHAQEFVPPEPIFWDTDTLANIRPFMKLRYAMAPYNYTLAYTNSTEGMPLMRPLAFVEDDPKLMSRTDGYMWGDAFLVYPVVEPKVETMNVYFPSGSAWFDFFSGQRYEGGELQEVATSLSTLPVFVRAGAWVPMIPEVHSLGAYPYESLQLNYWHDATIGKSKGMLYEDDGITPGAIEKRLFEKSRMQAVFIEESGILTLSIKRDGGTYPGRVEARTVEWVIHQVKASPTAVLNTDGRALDFSWSEGAATLTVPMRWEGESLSLDIHF